MLTNEGYEFDNGTLLLWPDEDDGAIRCVDVNGNSLDTRDVGDHDYDDWARRFVETRYEKLRRKYLESSGLICPYCGSEEISNIRVGWDDPLPVSVRCDQCGRTWTDIYTLADIVED